MMLKDFWRTHRPDRKARSICLEVFTTKVGAIPLFFNSIQDVFTAKYAFLLDYEFLWKGDDLVWLNPVHNVDKLLIFRQKCITHTEV